MNQKNSTDTDAKINKETEQEDNSDIVSNFAGLDIGTMNLIAATNKDDKTSISSLRNVFLEVEKSDIGTMNMSYVSHVEIDDKTYILSDDAYNFANVLGRKVSRPMHKGMVSPQEIDSVDILAIMLNQLIGKGEKDSVCCFSVPADPIDSERNVIYHQSVFERIIAQLGFKPQPLIEGVAVVYAECADSDFTGIGISFGAGMTNIAVVFKSVPVLTFSLTRGGDWIDENAAMSIGSISNRMTSLKEKDDFSLNDFTAQNKKERRMREALIYYYKSLIDYTTKNIVKELDNLTIEFPSNIPIIVAGGTSMVNGFVEAVADILGNYEFPFEISQVKAATNQLTAVAEGCLVKSRS